MNIDEILNIIKDAAFEVRKNLPPGFLESVYQNALMIELSEKSLIVSKETPIPVYYKGNVVGDFRADILVNGKVIIELKAVRELLPIHEAQLVNYLTATSIDYGVLINYGGDNYRYIKKTRIYHRSPTGAQASETRQEHRSTSHKKNRTGAQEHKILRNNLLSNY